MLDIYAIHGKSFKSQYVKTTKIASIRIRNCMYYEGATEKKNLVDNIKY